MPRKARDKSESGIYHIMLRGINKQSIFEDDEDREKFLQILTECKEICKFQLFAYCIMGNHIHLLIKVEKEPLEQIFKRIGARYVYWYNWKYRRCGHLFQDRYKSEPIEDDSYFLIVLRYILQNPVKVGLCQTLEEYKWSSYNDYINEKGITDIDFGLNILSSKKNKVIEIFTAYMNEPNEDKCLELEDVNKRITDDELKRIVEKDFNIKPMMIQNEPRDKMQELLRKILKIEGVSTRQLARITGISANIIWRL